MQLTETQRAYLEMIIGTGGGIITCGEHLGVFVSSPENVADCPAGWMFVDVTATSVEQLAECLAVAHQGRAAWPGVDPTAGIAPPRAKVTR